MELDEREGGEGGWMPRRFIMSHRLIPSVLACGESLVMNDSFSASIRGETLQNWSVILENTQVQAHKKWIRNRLNQPDLISRSGLLVFATCQLGKPAEHQLGQPTPAQAVIFSREHTQEHPFKIGTHSV